MDKKFKYQDESLSFKERAKDMVAHMTIEQCAAQMLFSSARVEEVGIEFYNWWNEALHGVARAGMATVFPQAIGLAATFDEELIQKVADVISTEGRAMYNMYQKYEDYGIYKGITFWSPNVNIFRDPRWGRGQETYGEDPYLTSRLGIAFVKGLQGNDERYLKTAACAKHFAVHSGPEKIRHEFDAIATPLDMEETYLPAFKALVESGVEGVMGAYNRTNGEPCCGSKTLLKELLREKWGFDGYVTSDCWAISDFHLHHDVTSTPTESVALALENGCDLNCGNMYGYLLQALQEGKITEEMIRTSTERLLTTRMKLGMFDENTPFDKIRYDVVDCEEHRAINEEVARKSLVLLKNNGILPLDKTKLKNVAVMGPNANSIIALEGNYHGTANQYHTVLEAIRRELPNARVNYSEGCHLYEYKLEDPGYAGDRLAEVKAHVDMADVVIVVVGLDETVEGEEMVGKEISGDKDTLYLPQSQRDLIRTACERNKPVVLVNLTGSAIDFEYGNEHAAAIIQAWYPGAMGGKAVADLIFGNYNPSGRLPVTFYREENQLPDFTDYSMEGRTYKFIKEDPLYPFGFGLSYTRFSYGDMKLDTSKVRPGEKVTGTVTVTNVGNREGEEIVQIYLKDDEASVRVPHHKLCGIKRISLKPQESTKVSFAIDAEQFMIITVDGVKQYEPGSFTVYAGGSQPDPYSVALNGCKGISQKIVL
ncbi:MAG: bxlB [Herbinix sp.]|nr:bxlB [Herbinix sp.]